MVAVITDVTTAQAALPKLQEAAAALGVSGRTARLSTEQLPPIKEAACVVLAIPGVTDVVKPA